MHTFFNGLGLLCVFIEWLVCMLPKRRALYNVTVGRNVRAWPEKIRAWQVVYYASIELRFSAGF